MNAVTCQPSTWCLRETKRVKMFLKLYVCKLCPFRDEPMMGRGCLVSLCRAPKKLSFNVSLRLPLHSDQGSPFAAQMILNMPKNTQFSERSMCALL